LQQFLCGCPEPVLAKSSFFSNLETHQTELNSVCFFGVEITTTTSAGARDYAEVGAESVARRDPAQERVLAAVTGSPPALVGLLHGYIEEVCAKRKRLFMYSTYIQKASVVLPRQARDKREEENLTQNGNRFDCCYQIGGQQAHRCEKWRLSHSIWSSLLIIFVCPEPVLAGKNDQSR
jgi:hypothetical protein